jgi:glycosyltransferase involved in cell wall biosynthesis
MMSKGPLVSAVIPVYNGEAFVGRAVRSVLSQDYSPVEVIVVDDGSIDGTEQAVKSIEGPIIYLRQQSLGPAAARNLGIEKSSGEFVAFLDSDDEWLDERLVRCLQPMLDNPEVGMTYSRALVKKPDGSWGIFHQEFKRYRTFPPVLWPDPLQHASATTCRRSVIEEVGDFEVSLAAHEDHDMWIRLGEAAGVIEVEEALVRLHSRDQGLSRSTDLHTIADCRRKVIDRALDRRPERYGTHSKSIMADYYLSMGICAYAMKDFGQARNFTRQSLRLIPTLRGIGLMLQTLVPDRAMSQLRLARDRLSRYS